MGKAKRRPLISTRSCILLTMVCMASITILYEVLVFCTLDRIKDASNMADTHAFKDSEANKRDTNFNKVTSINRIHADKVLHEFAGFRNNDLNDLEGNAVLNTVHYVWCSNKTFEFRHYLSVLSVWKILQPDMIEFHTSGKPGVDKYNTWFEEIQTTVPGFVVKNMPPNWDGDDKGCGFWFGIALIDDRGGIYLGENVLITDAILKHRRNEVAIFVNKDDSKTNTEIALAMGKAHQPEYRTLRKSFDDRNDIVKDIRECGTIGKSLVMNSTYSCFLLDEHVHPYNIFQLSSQFGSYVRKLVYGSAPVLEAKPFLPGTIPKIVHYVWFGNKEMNFLMYLSMLSTLFIVNADKVYIHWDGYLKGAYFDRVIRDKRVILVLREKPLTIFGKKVLYTQHRSDVVRAECLLKYGGIYMDWDVLWLRDPQDLIKTGYDAIANFDHMPQKSFPETINLGVLMAKPKSTFVKRWQDALVNYKSEDFLYNAVQLPYKIYEKFPEYLHIERTLQVMCYQLKCHPAFHPEFKQFMHEQPFDWRTDVYSIHFTHPDPEELSSEKACREGEGRFAEIGQFILKHHHKLD